MANIDNFVTVTVTKTSAAVTRQGFSTPLGLFQVSTSIIPTRYASFSSTTEMTTAGFATTDPAFLWAQTVFGQEVAPTSLAIGRRGPGVAQITTATVTTAADGVWSLTIDGVTFSFTASSSTELQIAQGLLDAIAASDTDTTLDGTNVLVPTPALVAANFDVTANIAGESFTTGGDVMTTPGGGVGTFVTGTAGSIAEDITTAILAVQVENDTWYITTAETRQDADILKMNTWVAGEAKLFIAQTSDQDVLTNTPANIGLQLAATNNRRTQCRWYHQPKQYSDGAMAGRASAFQLDQEDGAGTWAIKQLQTVVASPLTSSEITNLELSGCDASISVGGRSATINGASVEGEFMDVQSTLDWTASRVKEDVFAVKATTPTKVGFSDEGIANIQAAVLGVLLIGVTNGHYSADDPTLPRVLVPRAVDVSVADKNARILRNVIGEAILEGAIHETIVQVNVTA